MQINEDKTVARFGHSSDQLDSNSLSQIVTNCQRTGKEIDITFLKYNTKCMRCGDLKLSP